MATASPTRQRSSFAVRATLIAGLAWGATQAATAGVVFIGPAWPGPWPGWPMTGPFVYPGACWPYGSCFGPPWDERRQRQRAAAPDPPPPVDPDIWGSSGSPWGYVRRLPPPTPESQIQPRYRDASTIRPEYGGP